jgi:YfiH family protein
VSGPLVLARWDAPGPYVVAFSGRKGGVSEGSYASLNLGLATADERENVEENRRRFFVAAGAEGAAASWPRQIHGADVVRAGGRGMPADAVWTDERGCPIVVVSADCVPVALARIDGGGPAVVLAHVGWRGLLAGVIPTARAALGGGLVAAAIGPAIGPCCYEVGEEVSGPIRAAYGTGVARDGRLDLPGAVERALRAAGCARVDRLDECTACNPERYFSHRRDGARTGRQGAVAYVS